MFMRRVTLEFDRSGSSVPLRRLLLASALATSIVGGAAVRIGSAQAARPHAVTPTIPHANVTFGHEPYLDHTQAIIALRQNWFSDVGITIQPKPYGKIISSDNTVPVLGAGTVDVESGSAPLFLPAKQHLPPFKCFVYGDLFQGYAIMAQPNGHYKSVDELVKSGMSRTAAIRTVIQQMKGKRFALPPEAAIKGFINLALASGGLTLSDLKTIVADDSKTSAMMIGGQADFQVGGVPSHLTLQTKGFKPIITSFDLAVSAKPTATSPQLQAVFYDGWCALDKWIDANHDTMLRMASVLFRISAFQNAHRSDALAIHVPFLNSVAGTNFSSATAIVVYTTLDPFLTFAQERRVFLDPKYPLNEQYVTGAAIKLWEDKGLFPRGSVKVHDVSTASDVYREMLSLQNRALLDVAVTRKALQHKTGASAIQARTLLTRSSFYLGIYDYLDASRFAAAALAAAQAH